MDFLKAILDGELFAKLETAINAYNGNPENKDKQIKLGNLSSGEYVGKGKYDALQELLTGKQTELDTANGLIAQLKKGTKDNEDLQGKIAGYESTVQQLQAQLAETKLNSAVKVWLMGEKALDVDYLTYKLTEKLKADGKTLELDETENIKGRDDLLSGLKTQFPNMFESGNGGRQVFEGGKLPGGDPSPVTVTREAFAKMGYNERLRLKQENEPLFKQLTTR